jgi:hypothetical protein
VRFLDRGGLAAAGGVRVAGTQAEQTQRLAELIGRARSVVALTGAGISVPSGIPDFRPKRGKVVA